MNIQSTLTVEEPAVDLAIALGYADELENYIIKDDLYRTVWVRTPNGDQSMQMTIGDLLARLHRLQAQRSTLTAQQQTQLDEVQQRVSSTIYGLRTRAHDRLQREMKARLDSLKWYLDEGGEDQQRFRGNFPSEMRNRQRIEEILKELGDEVAPEYKERLKSIDHRIRMMSGASKFIWDERWKEIYPQVPYWYLYVRP